MRKGFYLGAFLLFSFSLMSVTCSDDDNSVDNSEQIAQTKAIAESGTWRITNFNDSGIDETSDFIGYNFTFLPDGTINASRDGTNVQGTWFISSDDSSSDDDGDDNDIEFNIFFSVSNTNNFIELNDDWDIIAISATKIELIDVSGGNGGTDLLTLEMN